MENNLLTPPLFLLPTFCREERTLRSSLAAFLAKAQAGCRESAAGTRHPKERIGTCFVVPHVKLSLELISVTRNARRGRLDILFRNLNPAFITRRFLYVELYYALISNRDFINFSPHKIFISIAITDRHLQGIQSEQIDSWSKRKEWSTDTFMLHSNYYYGNTDLNMGLNHFLAYTLESYLRLIKDSIHAYFGFNIVQVLVHVYDIAENKNSHIKSASNELSQGSPRSKSINDQVSYNTNRKSTATLRSSHKPFNGLPGKRLFSTTSLLSAFKKDKFNAKNFTPLKQPNPLNTIKHWIVACDIETVKHAVGKQVVNKNGSTLSKYIQIPALITLTYFNINTMDVETHSFNLNFSTLKMNGLKVALAEL